MKFCLFIFEKTFSNHIQLSGFVYNNLFIPHQFKHTIWTSVSFDPSLFALSPHFSLNLKLTSFPLGLKGVAETQEMFPCLRGMSNLKILWFWSLSVAFLTYTDPWIYLKLPLSVLEWSTF